MFHKTACASQSEYQRMPRPVFLVLFRECSEPIPAAPCLLPAAGECGLVGFQKLCLASVMEARWSSEPLDGVRLPGEVLLNDADT